MSNCTGGRTMFVHVIQTLDNNTTLEPIYNGVVQIMIKNNNMK